MDVHPSFGVNPPGPTTAEPFAPEALYEIKIDTDGDVLADIAYQVRFTPSEGGAQTATLRRLEGGQTAGMGEGGQVIVEGAPVSMGGQAQVTEAGDYRFLPAGVAIPSSSTYGRPEQLSFHRRRFLGRQRRLQHCAGSGQLSSGNERGWPVGTHSDPGGGDGGGWVQARPRRAAPCNSLSSSASRTRSIALGAGERRAFHPSLRPLAGAYRRIFGEEATRLARTLFPDLLRYDPTRPAAYPHNGRKPTDDAAMLSWL